MWKNNRQTLLTMIQRCLVFVIREDVLGVVGEDFFHSLIVGKNRG